MVSIRVAGPNDCPKIVEMLIACLKEDDIGIPLVDNFDVKVLLDVYQSVGKSDDDQFLIAEKEIDGKYETVGMLRVWLSNISPYHQQISTFGFPFVVESERNGNVAFKLCEAAYRWLRHSGCTYAVNFSSVKTPHSKLYERFNFKARATMQVGKVGR